MPAIDESETPIIDAEVVTNDDAAVTNVTSLERQTRGEINIQISTARAYPRSIKEFKDEALEMATLDDETAESCLYALPRGGKTIEGPSARFAEIISAAWGHMRVEGRVVDIDDEFVTARGAAWDVQKDNYVALETKRRITTSAKNGRPAKRYDQDMIMVTANAAIAIATRNARLNVIPKAFWWPVYLACRQVVAGDAKTLASRRQAMLDHFMKLGVLPAQVFTSLGVKGVEDISLDQLVTLKSTAAAIKSGETTIESAFSGVDANAVHGDPVDDYLAQLPPDEQQQIRDLIVQTKMPNGQIAAKLKAFTNNPKGLVEDLAKAVAVQEQASAPKDAPKSDSKDAGKKGQPAVSVPSADDIFKAAE